MFFLLIAGVATADVESDERWIGNDNLAVGIHEDGSLINGTMELGVLWDPDGTGGPIPLSGDMLYVGNQWDLVIWDWETTSGDGGRRVQGGPYTEDWRAAEWLSKTNNDVVTGLRGQLSDGPLQIEYQIAALHRADVVVYDLIFRADESLSELDVGKAFDPDQDYWFSESYRTVNESDDNWAYGASAFDGRAIALAGRGNADAEVSGGVCRWCDSPREMLESAGRSNINDRHPNVLVRMEDIEADTAISVRFVYAFTIDGEAAKDLAIEMLDLTDMDEDGLSTAEGDCDDWNPDTYADATEIMDGEDNDCDGEVDEDSLASDDDGDGFSEADGDCDDDDGSIFPGAEAVDGVTNADCDGISDRPDEEDDFDDEEDASTDAVEAEDTGEANGADTNEEDGTDTGETEGIDTDNPDADALDTGNTDEENPESEGLDSETETASPGFETEDGGVVIAGTKQGCSCATGQPATPWSWVLLLLALIRRRKENS